MPADRRWVFARSLGFPLICVLAGCSGTSSSPSTPSGTTVTAAVTPTPPPPATPTPTALPTPTATPAATCGLALSDATFEPQRIVCPTGNSTQTVRAVFDLTAAGGLPITVNRVSTSGVTCRGPFATCNWAEGPLSVSPTLIPAGTRSQIVVTQQFSCGATGNPRSGIELIWDKLFVNTSCGAAREIGLTNTLTIVL